MSTADQARASELHGTALLLAQDPALQPLLNQLADLTGGRDDLRTQEAGILAGLWFAAPGRHLGHDRDQLEQAVRVGYERGSHALRGYDPTDATG